MAKKLFVGGVPFSCTNEALKAHFEQAGTVESATIIMDRATGRSKGFGFVEMATEEEAQKAISMLNGTDMEGRAINVSEARPMAERPQRESRDRRW
ncbi:MAG: RNA-binding protein [Candidatus Falkowbacteria bacterium]|nr:RNA-binding protein [Candidatus Falkowbacteria bacterium]